MKRLSHIGSDGRVRMVDVSAKPPSLRIAIATGKIKIKRATANAISRNRIGKGNVFATAQIAGIQAAKRTAELIPLCHPLPLSNVEIDFEMKAWHGQRNLHRTHHRANWCRNGSAHGRRDCAADDLRHVQSHRQRDGDFGCAVGEKREASRMIGALFCCHPERMRGTSRTTARSCLFVRSFGQGRTGVVRAAQNDRRVFGQNANCRRHHYHFRSRQWRTVPGPRRPRGESGSRKSWLGCPR